MQKAANGHLEIERGVESAAGGDWQQGLGLGPPAKLFHGGDQGEPTGNVIVAQAAGTVFHVRLEMKDRVAEFVMAGACEFAQILDECVAFAGNQSGNGFFAEAQKKVAITGQIAAIEEGNCEFKVVRIETFALGKGTSGGTEFQAQVPKFLREATNRIFKFVFRIAAGVQKEQIDVGVRKEPASAIASGRYQSKILRGAGGIKRIGIVVLIKARSSTRCGRLFRCGWDDDFVPEGLDDGVDEGGAAIKGATTVACVGKFKLDGSRFARVEVGQLAANGGLGVHLMTVPAEQIVRSQVPRKSFALHVRPRFPCSSNCRNIAGPIAQRLKDAFAAFVVANADCFVDPREKDLSVANFAGAGAAFAIACTAFSTASSARTISSFTLGIKSTVYSRPR